MEPVTLITGASAGIGAALAHDIRRATATSSCWWRGARTGSPSWPTRSPPRATASRLFLPVDLERADAVERIGDVMVMLGVEPEIVVNNAGFGLLGAAATLDRAEQLAMIDLNVRALTELSLAFVDSLERHRGGILNVASVAAFHARSAAWRCTTPTKAYVLSFSEALHHELAAEGRAGDRAVPRPGADRIPGPRRHHRHDLSAAADALRRAGGRGGLSRAQGAAAAWWCRALPTRW